MQPRMTPQDRLAGQGFDYFFTPALEQVQEAFPAAFRPLLDPIDLARQAVELHSNCQPDQALADYRPRVADRQMAAARRLKTPDVLDASTVHIALSHTDTLRHAVRSDGTGADALRLVGQVIKGELGDVEISVGTMMTADYHLEVLSQRLQRPELDPLPSHERVQLLVKDINDAKASGAHFSSGPIPVGSGVGGGGGDGGVGTTGPGYARIYAAELRTLMVVPGQVAPVPRAERRHRRRSQRGSRPIRSPLSVD